MYKKYIKCAVKKYTNINTKIVSLCQIALSECIWNNYIYRNKNSYFVIIIYETEITYFKQELWNNIPIWNSNMEEMVSTLQSFIIYLVTLLNVSFMYHCV